MNMKPKIKIAFVVGLFPSVSETFIIDQVAGLLDRDIDLEIFSFRRPKSRDNISAKFFKYNMASRTHYLEMPSNRLVRILKAVLLLPRLILRPYAWQSLDIKKYGNDAASLKLLCWVSPFIGKKFDLAHLHFGTIATDFLTIKKILNIKTKLTTSFYGYDASLVFKTHADAIYDRLRQECQHFLAMSENMKQRLIDHGFKAESIQVHPVGVNVREYQFKERQSHEAPVEIVSVGRFVEKKGFDDLLRALALVREKLGDVFRCTIVGDGPLREPIHGLAKELKLEKVLDFKGYLPIEKITSMLMQMDFFVQPSKTASNGDME
jgi:colanic acid/amylovoran biosynthesis glycosyltransferase